MPLDASGGHRWLDSFVLASVIQLGTLRFCERFLNRSNDPCGRQFDQMTQAARSGRMNIIEGSERSATSKETEMRLTDVAKASLGELRGDYETWLLKKDLPPWKRQSPEARRIYDIQLDKPQYSDDVAHDSAVHILTQRRKFSPWLDSDDDVIAANTLNILLGRTILMLQRQLEWQHRHFLEHGGFRESLSSDRKNLRAEQEGAPSCPLCTGPMQRRQARAGDKAGQVFWGCTNYPNCKGIRPLGPS